MANEEEKAPSFKVNDRRRFSSEGELKPEFRGEADVSSADAPDTSSASAASRTEQTARANEQTRRGPQAGLPPAELTFGTFLVGLSTQALVLLGDVPDPESGKPSPPDLRGAQQVIDIIAMLREKTRGNLDREEEQLIEAVLYELRMKYVERARQPPR